MALRRYQDSTGTEWKVWDVPARFTPLRAEAARRSQVDHDVKMERRNKLEETIVIKVLVVECSGVAPAT